MAKKGIEKKIDTQKVMLVATPRCPVQQVALRWAEGIRWGGVRRVNYWGHTVKKYTAHCGEERQ